MDVCYREARPEDLPACVDLFFASLSDLLRRQNRPTDDTPAAERMLAFYEHALSTGIFQVAEADGRLAALACALVRDRLWFLSGFWTRPDLRQQHIGMNVLRRVWEAGKRAAATHFFVWSSYDLPAMAAYMKLGMLPGSQIMDFEGTPRLTSRADADFTVEPLLKSFAMEVDETILGTGREVDHDFLSRRGWKGRQVLRNGKRLGYYYLDGGSIGPAAWMDGWEAGSILTAACREVHAAGTEVSLRVPGMNHAALRFAFESGLRLCGFAHLLMSAPFGQLEQYIPSGPAMF